MLYEGTGSDLNSERIVKIVVLGGLNSAGRSPYLPTRTDKSRQEPTRGIFMHFSIKLLLIRPYSCVVYLN